MRSRWIPRARNSGANDFGAKKEIGIFMEMFQRCKNPLVIQLLIILPCLGHHGRYSTTVVVGGMVLLSVVLGYVQEHRSSKAVEQLQAMVETNCLVIRAGKQADIPMVEIVPGDILVLQAGAIIPADLRLVSAKDFFVSQSSLTGESMPVEKITGPSDISGRGVIELPERLLPGEQRPQRLRPWRRRQYRTPHPLWLDFGKTLGRASADQL